MESAVHTPIFRCLFVVQDRALDYLSTCIDQVHTFGDILQLVIVELIYKVGGAESEYDSVAFDPLTSSTDITVL